MSIFSRYTEELQCFLISSRSTATVYSKIWLCKIFKITLSSCFYDASRLKASFHDLGRYNLDKKILSQFFLPRSWSFFKLKNYLLLCKTPSSNKGATCNCVLTVSRLAFGGFSKHHASIPTKGYIKIQNFLLPRPPADANRVLCLVRATQMHQR